MNYELHEKWNDMDFGGSALVGTYIIPRDELVKRFGEPTQVNGQRIKERWLFKFEDGTIGTIFNDVKMRRMKENEWCIGGFGHMDKKTKENISYRTMKEMLDRG
tara:strand:+ start:780 stop:1091 length:312 start_codon:yes stop_codon:yes gene_type:complete